MKKTAHFPAILCVASLTLLTLGSSFAATAIATVPDMTIWGVGIREKPAEAEKEALEQCNIDRARQKSKSICRIATSTTKPGGGAIFMSPKGTVFSIGNTSEEDAIKEAQIACHSEYQGCATKPVISWYEKNGIVSTDFAGTDK